MVWLVVPFLLYVDGRLYYNTLDIIVLVFSQLGCNK